jgi:hypothetical protein
MISPEVNVKNMWCDIVIAACENQSITDRYAIELVAHARDGPVTKAGTVLEHFDGAANSYSQLKGVKEVWVINFCTRPFADKDTYVWPSKNSGVRAMHICHTLNWTKATVVVDSDKAKCIKVDLREPN